MQIKWPKHLNVTLILETSKTAARISIKPKGIYITCPVHTLDKDVNLVESVVGWLIKLLGDQSKLEN